MMSMRAGAVGLLVVICGLTVGVHQLTQAAPGDLAGAGAAGYDVDYYYDSDPVWHQSPVELRWPARLWPLWKQALEREEADLHRQAAATIVKAHRLGMPDLDEAVPRLLELAIDGDRPRAVRIEAARALIALDAREQAAELMRVLPVAGVSWAQVVEPALAAWKYKPAGEMWLQRLQGDEPSGLLRRLAIEGLGQVPTPGAAEVLEAIVQDQAASQGVRLAAAEALGTSQTEGLLPLARQLAADSSQRLESIMAASLLQRHEGGETLDLLDEMALSLNDAAARRAVDRLLELDPERVAARLEQLVDHSEPAVRLACVEAVRARPNPERIAVVARVMGDTEPVNRVRARKVFEELADQDELRDSVIAAAMKLLQGDAWRSLEQSSLLLGNLDYKVSAGRMVELVDSERPEVMVASAYALKKFEVPETLPALLDRAQRVYPLLQAGGGQHYTEQLDQVFQLFRQLLYRPADQEMRKYIPKYTPGPRVAAIWALGHLHADSGGPEDLARLFEERMIDDNPNMPEEPEVRAICAISLGRMKIRAAIPSIEKWRDFDGPGTQFGMACFWAMNQLNGDPIPDPPLVIRQRTNWFLEPIAD